MSPSELCVRPAPYRVEAVGRHADHQVGVLGHLLQLARSPGVRVLVTAVNQGSLTFQCWENSRGLL